MDKEYCVYCHTAPNGKRYIGITCQSVNDRWSNGLGYVGCTRFWKAINKYGWPSFKHEVLYCGLTQEEASDLERKLIAEFKTTDPSYGYNIEPGGFNGGHPTSEETKKKISNANRGRPCPEHQKAALSKLNKGKMPTNLSANHKMLEKPVDQLDLDGNYMATFPSIRIAGRECGISENGIGLCCRGHNKTAGGYKWRFSLKMKRVVLCDEHSAV